MEMMKKKLYLNICHVDSFSSSDVTSVKQILTFMNSPGKEGIHYGAKSNPFLLKANGDSYFVKEITKNPTGFVIMFGRDPINWCSLKATYNCTIQKRNL